VILVYTHVLRELTILRTEEKMLHHASLVPKDIIAHLELRHLFSVFQGHTNLLKELGASHNAFYALYERNLFSSFSLITSFI
jgi:hypothetical protein